MKVIGQKYWLATQLLGFESMISLSTLLLQGNELLSREMEGEERGR